MYLVVAPKYYWQKKSTPNFIDIIYNYVDFVITSSQTQGSYKDRRQKNTLK